MSTASLASVRSTKSVASMKSAASAKSSRSRGSIDSVGTVDSVDSMLAPGEDLEAAQKKKEKKKPNFIKAILDEIKRFKASSKVFDQFNIAKIRVLFIVHIITDTQSCYTLRNEAPPNAPPFGDMALCFILLPYIMMGYALKNFYLELFMRDKDQGGRGWKKPRAVIAYLLTFLPLFVFYDLKVATKHITSEPKKNDLFTYIRVRQVSDACFLCLPL